MRTPNEIRDSALRCFNQTAPAKYDVGQAKSEVTNNLDKHPDLIGALREELLDAWFYLGSLQQQVDDKDCRIDELKKEVERWKEQAKR